MGEGADTKAALNSIFADFQAGVIVIAAFGYDSKQGQFAGVFEFF